MNWAEFAAEAPELAALGEERIRSKRVALLGTISGDGTPRISPLEVLFVDGELMLGMMWQSRKALDLVRDPRCLLHNAVSHHDGSDGEFKLSARAIDVPDGELRERYGVAAEEHFDWRPPEPYHLFRLEIERVAFVEIKDTKQHVTRWRPGRPAETIVREFSGSGYVDPPAVSR